MGGLHVSVIIPTHNRAAIVTRAVESALAAARPGDEVLVLDDGSTGDTAKRLATYTSRIRYLRSAHGARYQEVLATHQRARAKALLVRGRTREAREGFRLAGSSTPAERMLAALPGPLTKAIVNARRRLKPVYGTPC